MEAQMQQPLKTLSLLVVVLAVAAPSASAHRASPSRSTCLVPSLKGLTVAKARIRAAHAHCKLRIAGAALRQAEVQTVVRQFPLPLRRSHVVTVWIESLPVESKQATPGPAVAGGKPSQCSIPNLTGLTVVEAEARAAATGCKLQIEGAPVKYAEVQTVERQYPEASQSSEGVTVWINPLCVGEAAYGPSIQEPLVTPGPAELVSGFFLAGGGLDEFSTPECKRPEPSPMAGTVEVLDAKDTVVATATSTYGQFVEIPLPPGSYTIRGTFLQAEINGVHPNRIQQIEIPPGHTVREDFVLGVR